MGAHHAPERTRSAITQRRTHFCGKWTIYDPSYRHAVIVLLYGHIVAAFHDLWHIAKVAMQSVISREFQPPTLENLSMCTVVFRSSFSVATGTRVYARIVRKATMIHGNTHLFLPLSTSNLLHSSSSTPNFSLKAGHFITALSILYATFPSNITNYHPHHPIGLPADFLPSCRNGRVFLGA